jgi:hypothetical protein
MLYENGKPVPCCQTQPESLPKDLSLLRMRFLSETEEKIYKSNYLIVAVKLPSGAIEIITNTQWLIEKAEYYKNTYDDNFCLKTNPAIQIVGFMLV